VIAAGSNPSIGGYAATARCSLFFHRQFDKNIITKKSLESCSVQSHLKQCRKHKQKLKKNKKADDIVM
jgi:hypothetical protein